MAYPGQQTPVKMPGPAVPSVRRSPNGPHGSPTPGSWRQPAPVQASYGQQPPPPASYGQLPPPPAAYGQPQSHASSPQKRPPPQPQGSSPYRQQAPPASYGKPPPPAAYGTPATAPPTVGPVKHPPTSPRSRSHPSPPRQVTFAPAPESGSGARHAPTTRYEDGASPAASESWMRRSGSPARGAAEGPNAAPPPPPSTVYTPASGTAPWQQPQATPPRKQQSRAPEGQRVRATRDICVRGTVLVPAGACGTLCRQNGDKCSVHFDSEPPEATYNVHSGSVVPIQGTPSSPVTVRGGVSENMFTNYSPARPPLTGGSGGASSGSPGPGGWGRTHARVSSKVVVTPGRVPSAGMVSPSPLLSHRGAPTPPARW
eukprot:Hpha_TRINITY_DN11520_c0_g2::TRINITY_DN11520_c0_g2_i1::g.32293::m.32293